MREIRGSSLYSENGSGIVFVEERKIKRRDIYICRKVNELNNTSDKTTIPTI